MNLYEPPPKRTLLSGTIMVIVWLGFYYEVKDLSRGNCDTPSHIR